MSSHPERTPDWQSGIESRGKLRIAKLEFRQLQQQLCIPSTLR